MKQVTRTDPLRLCVFATVALLTWLIGAPVVAVMSGLGLRAYARTWREGTRRSRCVLGDVRLVLAYLAVIFVASTAWTAWRVVRL
ncbi:MAG: hypothetical protein M3144_12030, partial [Actinomycetota bacterium]|nr:hypothetical protein [Actinomycetota bacterium]